MMLTLTLKSTYKNDLTKSPNTSHGHNLKLLRLCFSEIIATVSI